MSKSLLSRPMREGDTGIGRRCGAAVCVDATITPEELRKLPVAIGGADEEDEEVEASNGWTLPATVRKVLIGCLLAIGAVLGMVLVAEAASFVANVRAMPMAMQIALGIPACVFAAVILWMLFKLCILSWRLKTSPQIKSSAVAELSERAALQAAAKSRSADAKRQLCALLKDEYATLAATLRKMKADEELISGIVASRNRLLNGCNGSDGEWIARFKTEFQDPLENFVMGRIHKKALASGVAAGASPYPLFDQLIVLSAMMAIGKDVLTVYRLKPTWGCRVALLVRGIVALTAVGYADKGEDVASEMIEEHIGDAATVAGGVAAKVAPKILSGAFDGFLVDRIGKRMVRIVQPVI